MRLSTSEPRYRQIQQWIRGQIEGGSWSPGHRVPSENELVEKFGVARMTVNRAMRELQQDGMLVRRAGLGTFVASAERQSSLLDIRNIADEIRERGKEHTSRVLKRGRVNATRTLRAAFESAGPAALDLFHVRLVHFEDGTPVQLEDRYVQPSLVPGFLDHDFTTTTPTEVLLSALVPHELEHTVSAVLPTVTQARHLEIDRDQPCLQLHRRSWSSGQVVTLADLIYPANRYTLSARHRPTAAGRA